MNITISLSIALAMLWVQAAFALPASQFTKGITEPDGVGNKVGLEFANSAEYKQQFSSAVEDARKACEQYLREHQGASDMAIVADIDETVLDNREHFEETTTFDWDKFIIWAEKSKAPPLKQTSDFLDWARKKGFAIFFVTGRPESLRAATIRNMVRNGIAYDGLYLRADKDNRSAIEVKTEIRRKIEKMGFKVVVNIGDQVSDLVGGYAVDCEKLPNKIYFVD